MRSSGAYSSELLAYAAGVIDSDGSICVGVATGTTRSAGVSPRRYIEVVSLGQIDVGAVDLFHRAFGGSRFVSTSRRPGARPLHGWRVTHRRACALLEATLPYLRIKRTQAQLCLALRRLKDEERPRPEEMAEIRDQVRRLNRIEGRSERYTAGPSMGSRNVSQSRREVLAYAAGVIDSDGSVRIHRDSYAKRTGAGQATYHEWVKLGQIEPQAVELLHEQFGGSRRVVVPRADTRQPLHSLEIVDRQAASLLGDVLPFLVIKRAQAQKCLELRNLKEQSRKARFAEGRGHRGAGPRPEWISAAMEQLFTDVAALNRRVGATALIDGPCLSPGSSSLARCFEA